MLLMRIITIMILASGLGGLRGARIGGVGGIVIAPIMTEMAVKGQVVMTVVEKDDKCDDIDDQIDDNDCDVFESSHTAFLV